MRCPLAPRADRFPLAWLAASSVLYLVTTACVTRRDYQSPYGPVPVERLARWDVLSTQAGSKFPIGQIEWIEIQGADESVRRYEIRTSEGQHLGFIDPAGRVFQRVPFSMAELYRGLHPMQEGLALLFERPGPFDLRAADSGAPAATDDWPTGVVEATAPKSGR